MAFHDIDDILKIQPKITSYGVTDFSDEITESEKIITRAVDARWYRSAAEVLGTDWRETPFDITLVDVENDGDQLVRLGCYKSIQLIYITLMKTMAEMDGFERLSDKFRKLYGDELNEVLAAGIDYDWSGDDTISSDEKAVYPRRRLYRM